MRKEASTNFENEKSLVFQCPVNYTLKIVGGRWKLAILWQLADQKLRFGELKRKIGKISDKMLSQQLRELEADGIVNRKVYPEVPPKVEYSMTTKGRKLKPTLNAMLEWGLEYVDT